MAPLALGQIVAITTWHAFRNVYSQINRQLFWLCNLFPHFLIWSGSSSKEQIVIILEFFVIGFVVKRLFFKHKVTILSLLFVGFSLTIIFLIRPNYFLIYFTIFITSLFAPMLNKIKIYRLSLGIWTLMFCFVTMIASFLAYAFTPFFTNDVIDFMIEVEGHF